MEATSVSVVVVSHGRPNSLMWCLSALAGVQHPNFEIVVVADLAGAAYVSESRFAEKVKLIAFEEANISAARNAGIKAAAGEIIAFIDDDAAAEPEWLTHLTQPFDSADIAVTGGYVRGRNGISYQWRAREVDTAGRSRDITPESDAPFAPQASKGYAIKTEGTNMAVRRSVLAELGGFDEAYRFYLDETDLNLRLAAQGHRTAIVPLAEVHHAYRASTRRGADRSVKSLFDVGASSALLLRKFGVPLDAGLAELRAEQTARLADQKRRRLVTKAEAKAALQSLEDGIEAGMERPFGKTRDDLAKPSGAFLRFVPERSGTLVISGRRWQLAKLLRTAEHAAASGVNVSLFCFGLTTRFHKVRFHEAGYWLQTGGQFGKSERSEPVFSFWRLTGRVTQEMRRVKASRGLSM